MYARLEAEAIAHSAFTQKGRRATTRKGKVSGSSQHLLEGSSPFRRRRDARMLRAGKSAATAGALVGSFAGSRTGSRYPSSAGEFSQAQVYRARTHRDEGDEAAGKVRTEAQLLSGGQGELRGPAQGRCAGEDREQCRRGIGIAELPKAVLGSGATLLDGYRRRDECGWC